jgi:hypothetical protein
MFTFLKILTKYKESHDGDVWTTFQRQTDSFLKAVISDVMTHFLVHYPVRYIIRWKKIEFECRLTNQGLI